MKQKKQWSPKNINALLVITVIIISILVTAFAYMTIGNTDNLAEYTSQIYQKPYAVNDAAWRMRLEILYARNTMLDLLNSDGNRQQQQDALDNMYRYRALQQELKNTLMTQYEGDKATVEKLYEDFDQIQALHDQGIALIKAGQKDAATTLLMDEAYPLYLEAEELVQEIIDDSQQAMSGYVQESYILNEQTNQAAVVWGIALVALTLLLSVLSVRTISKRNANIYHNDKLFSIISENVDAVFMVYDCKAQRVEYISENAERILGFAAEDYKKNMEISRAYFEETEFYKTRDFFNTSPGEILEYEYQIKDPDTGLQKDIVTKRYPIIEGGEVVKYVLMTSDLTEFKESQSALKAALENSEKANLAKREFLSRMSHEIRTPMNAVIGMTRILEYSMDDPEKAQGCLRKINMASMHLLELINNILDMSKIESGKLEIENKEFSINKMLSDIAVIIQPKAEENKLQFDVVLKNVVHDRVKGDEMRIKQVMLNFLSNSVKFTKEGGMIRVTVRELEKRGNQICLKFKVKDTGIGMNEKFMARIFEPFEQEEASTYRKYGGTGLGMALCKTLVESMGGTIEVESRKGEGSAFSFNLWLEALAEQEPEEQLSEHLRELNVLIIDDDIEVRGHLELLCRQMGVQAKAVASGFDAALLFKEDANRFDVCLIDLYMPDVDGIHTAEWIRERAGNDIYIVLMSAYDYKNIEKEALMVGVNDFMLKPVMIEDISSILRRAGGEVEALPVCRETKYDFSGKRLLIAEDNALNLEIVEELTKRVGFEVETAENGKKALEKFLESEPGYYDVILMDVHMPEMDGYEATRLIRASNHPQAKDIIIVAMTANAFYEDELEALKNGMNLHMSKPIEPEIIFAALQKILYDKKSRGI